MRQRALTAVVFGIICLASEAAAKQPSGFELPTNVEARLRTFLAAKYCGDKSGDLTKYSAASVPLSADNRPDVLVYINSPEWCGSGGCHLLAYRADGKSFRQIAEIDPVAKPPIQLLPARSKGWRDLAIGASGSERVIQVRVQLENGHYKADWNTAVQPNVKTLTVFSEYGDKPLCVHQ